MDLDIRNEVITANKRIKDYIRRTPLEFSSSLSKLCNCKVFLKLENWQITGSFKVRGGLNKILPLTGSGGQEVVAASTGNHAAAVGHALHVVGLNGIIFLPENVSNAKTDKLKEYRNVRLKYFGSDCVIAEKEAKSYAEKRKLVYVSPYNDRDVIAGQGTIGLEIIEELPDVDAVFVPVGGGGLISGISGYLKNVKNDIEIIACQPENSSVMYQSVKKGEILDLPSLPTISDGTAGGVENDSITFEFCKQFVDDWILVSEDEILDALKMIMAEHHMVVEGAAGLALAALIQGKERYADKSVVLILCGSKFDNELLKRLVCE